jgi:hypothetical protein
MLCKFIVRALYQVFFRRCKTIICEIDVDKLCVGGGDRGISRPEVNVICVFAPAVSSLHQALAIKNPGFSGG